MEPKERKMCCEVFLSGRRNSNSVTFVFWTSQESSHEPVKKKLSLAGEGSVLLKGGSSSIPSFDDSYAMIET